MFSRLFKSEEKNQTFVPPNFIGNRSYEEITAFWDYFNHLSEAKQRTFITNNYESFLDYKHCKLELCLLKDPSCCFKLDSVRDYFDKLTEQNKKQFESNYPQLLKLLKSELSNKEYFNDDSLPK